MIWGVHSRIGHGCWHLVLDGPLDDVHEPEVCDLDEDVLDEDAPRTAFTRRSGMIEVTALDGATERLNLRDHEMRPLGNVLLGDLLHG